MRRKILMLSDLQSGAEEIEIVDAASYDALAAKCQDLSIALDASDAEYDHDTQELEARIAQLEAVLRPLSDMCYRGPLWDAARACFSEEE